MADIIAVVIIQHAEDAAVLHATRSLLTCTPQVRLHHLTRFDQRLEAHLDGLGVAADDVWPLLDSTFDRPSCGSVFVAAVNALTRQQNHRIDMLISLCEAVPKLHSGLLSACGWLAPPRLRDVIPQWLRSQQSQKRTAAIAAFGMHRIDPPAGFASYFEDVDGAVRARAWRTAGEIGTRELVSTAAAAAIADEDPACQFWAAWAAVLLGDQHNALECLASVAASPGQLRARAFQLTLQAKGTKSAHAWLGALAHDPSNQRWLIRGAGLIGDPTYVPWLISQMADLKMTRLAGEAFSFITGLDLAWLDLEVKPPENFESGPNDDPNDPNVDMDEDDGLPWPDPVKIQAWWHANSHRFQPGTRYFMGEPLNRDNCLRVLKEGFQRQRIAAALYLSLLNPGTPLFEWRAPARRQQQLLAQMT